MIMAELPHLGQHCSVCSILDYLPVTCVYCKNVFCKDHRVSHKCISNARPYQEECKTNTNDFIKCHFCSSSVPIIRSSVCHHCLGRFCLLHRHQFDHQCPKLKRKEKIDDTKLNSEAEKILMKIRSEYKPGINLKNRGTKNNALALKVALMKLKSQGIGLESIPMEEREYFYLSFVPNEIGYNQDSKVFHNNPIFLCREWSIGKCIDWIAQKWSLTNRNNQPDKPKLILISEELFIEPKEDKKCCKKQNKYFCFSHHVKDLLSNGTVSTTDLLIVTYLI